MAMLVQQGSDVRYALAAHVLVGRSSACTVRLRAPQASAEHANLSFRDGQWTVRDLASRNGTFVNGDRLDPGGARVLAAGDVLAFGGPQLRWLLADASPPVAMARRLPEDELVVARDGLLALPSGDEPLACIVEGEAGEWLIEIDGGARRAIDGEAVSLGGRVFILHLPTGTPTTVARDEPQTLLDDLEIGLRVSADEEAVEVSVGVADKVQVLSPRAHFYTLLTLARLRLRQREATDLAELQRGWVSVDELCRMLAIDEYKLNVHVYRIRRDISGLGIAAARQLIERRRGVRQLRLATERVRIGALS